MTVITDSQIQVGEANHACSTAAKDGRDGRNNGGGALDGLRLGLLLSDNVNQVHY